ncbi:MAG: T9SS type A sorting domain-containing protein [Fidelibacterota bacterium]|nr:MAG: T9SS type A sorting domain-containing protein [Candidatus Neomarinimicrobiota bacterium]
MKKLSHIPGYVRPLLIAAGLVWFGVHPAGAQTAPDSVVVTIALPHFSVPADTDTVIVPMILVNEVDEVGGIQVDLFYGTDSISHVSGTGPLLASILTTGRTVGWKIDSFQLPRTGRTRILLYDPAGSNISRGGGSVMDLIFVIPDEVGIPDSVPLIIEAVIVSDAVGEALPARGMSGSLTLGSAVNLRVDSVTADQGETVALGVDMSNERPVTGLHFTLIGEAAKAELVGVNLASRTTRFQLEWKGGGDSARVWLFAQPGGELRPGAGAILELVFEIPTSMRHTDIDMHLSDARVGVVGERERILSRITQGRITVFPGHLDPPGSLAALSGHDGIVPLSWSPPSQIRREALSLTGYVLYRSEETPVRKRPETLLATLPSPRLAYSDSAVDNGRTYAYAVAAVYDERFESGLTEPVTATPVSWVDFALGDTAVMAGSQVVVPVRMKNDQPVAGIRFMVLAAPAGHLSQPRVVLGGHAAPDWVISLDRDTLSGDLSVIGFSPRLTTIPPGEGEVMLLTMDTESDVPVRVALEAREVVVSDASGNAYRTRVKPGSVSIDIQLARLRVGTGTPTMPGDTGYISIYMDNPQPVVAFQLDLVPALAVFEVVDVRGGSRLPADGRIMHSKLGRGGLRLIGSSFSHTPIPVGRGAVALVGYRVSPDAPKGLVGLNLERVTLSDERGHTLHQTTVSGSFPVGEIQSVFAPAPAEGEPGRSVTVPIALTNSIVLCEFQLDVGFDPGLLSFLSSESRERLPAAGPLTVTPSDTGHILLQYATGNGEPIQPGAGPLLNLVFLLDRSTPPDTTLSITAKRVKAMDCQEHQVFALGQSGELAVGGPGVIPEHFTRHLSPTGVTHFIRVHAATLGGEYLDGGDELAVIDSSALIGPQGETGPLMVGSGVIQPDGSVYITAVMGFEPGKSRPVLSGARAGGPIYFQAWDRQTNREGRVSANAQFVLGEGTWGENNGLTIVAMLRIPGKVEPVSELIPDKLEVEALVANPNDPAVTIRLGLPSEMEVRVAVYDLLGREVISLHDGITPAGFHEVRWDGGNNEGAAVKNGMFFYQVRTPDQTVTRKLLLMR